MPYKIEWFQNGVCIIASGKYSLNESIKFNGELYGDPRYETIKYEIGNYLDANVSFKLADARIVGTLDLNASRWNNHIKIAHVTKDKTFIEIIKAVTVSNASVIIMDEPTSSLTSRETDKLFSIIKEHGVLNQEIGERLIKTILSKGGSEDPNVLLRNFLGREPNSEAFLKDIGVDL